MKTLLPLSAMFIALLVLAGAVALGCGSDDSADVPDAIPTSSGTPVPPAIEDYLLDVAEILADATYEIDKIDTKFEEEFPAANNAEDADEALDDAILDYREVLIGGPAT